MTKLELKENLERKYAHTQARIKRIECVYVPVRNAARSKEFFMKYGLVVLSPVGNVKLASGQGIFFLETRELQSSNFVTHYWDEHNENHEMESLCFEVDGIHELYREMRDDGVRVTELNDSGDCGWGFCFYDPDGNKYAIWQDV